jgi:gas vesicle protein
MKQKVAISERQLRKIIREELARQYLVQEGLLDSIKKPFQKLSEKAKQIVSKKVDEVLEKISAALEGVQKPEGLDEFLKKFEQTEGGVDIKNLALEVGLEDAVSASASKEKIVATEGTFIVVRESFDAIPASAEDLISSFALIEGYYQKRALKNSEILNEALLTEAVGLTALVGVWWAAVKAAVGFLGGLSLACKLLAAIFEKAFNKPDIAKKLKHYEHVFHELEEKALRVLVYPAPVSYAAYLTASGLKKMSASNKKPKKLLSYEEFNSPENKDEKVAAEKLIHTALLLAIIFEAVSHIGHAIKELAENTSHALESIGHSAVEIGKEASALPKAARVAVTAGAQIT